MALLLFVISGLLATPWKAPNYFSLIVGLARSLFARRHCQSGFHVPFRRQRFGCLHLGQSESAEHAMPQFGFCHHTSLMSLSII